MTTSTGLSLSFEAAFAPFGGRSLTPGALGGLLGRIREASYDGLAVVSAGERRPLRWAIRRAGQGVLGADAVQA